MIKMTLSVALDREVLPIIDEVSQGVSDFLKLSDNSFVVGIVIPCLISRSLQDILSVTLITGKKFKAHTL